MEKNDILIMYGYEPEKMAYRAAEAADLAGLIGDRSKRVGLKPNLVVARPAEGGATTHPGLALGIIRYLRERGFADIVILEGSWVGDSTEKAFSACGYREVALETGARLVDTQKDKTVRCDCRGMPIDICATALAVDFMINLPVLKGHCQTMLTCALKNNKGVISNAEKRRFHTLGLHEPIAHLNTVARNDFILVDGICGDLDFEEGGNPVPAGRIFAARDPVLCDAFAAEQIGYDPQEIAYIPLAAVLGVGQMDTGRVKLTELNHSREGGGAPKAQGKARGLAAHTRPESACSACYAALIRALSRLEARERVALPEKVCIGQGYAGRGGTLGVGRCTAGFAHTVAGCPPSAKDMLEMLRTVSK